MDHTRKVLTEELLKLGYIQRKGKKSLFVVNPEKAEQRIRKELEGMIVPDDYLHPVFQRVYSIVLGREIKGSAILRTQFIECTKDEEVLKCLQVRGKRTGTSYPVHDVPRLEKRLTELAEDYKERLGGRDKLKRRYKPSLGRAIKTVVMDEFSASEKECNAWTTQYQNEFRADAIVAECIEKKGRNYLVKEPEKLDERLRVLIRKKQKARQARLDELGAKKNEKEGQKKRNAERPTLAAVAKEEYDKFHGGEISTSKLNYFCKSLREDPELMLCVTEGEGTSRKYFVEEPEYVVHVRQRIQEILKMPPEERPKPDRTPSKSLSKLIEESMMAHENIPTPTRGQVQHAYKKIVNDEGLKGLLERKGTVKIFYYAIGEGNIALAKAEVDKLLYSSPETIKEESKAPVCDADFLMVYFAHAFETRKTEESKKQLASTMLGDMVLDGFIAEKETPYQGTKRWHDPDDYPRRSSMTRYMNRFHPKGAKPKPSSEPAPKPKPKKKPAPTPAYSPTPRYIPPVEPTPEEDISVDGNLVVAGVRVHDFSGISPEKSLEQAIKAAKKYKVPTSVVRNIKGSFLLKTITTFYEEHPSKQERAELDQIFKGYQPMEYKKCINTLIGIGRSGEHPALYKQCVKILLAQLELRKK